jgi:hypothetical protein
MARRLDLGRHFLPPADKAVMRQKVRIQPYVSRELQRKLVAYAQTRRLTESAVAEAALTEYIDRDQIEQALVERRLDALAENVSRLQKDLDVVGQVLGSYARYAFLTAPAATTAAASQRAELVNADFLVSVARQLQAGSRLTGQVYAARPAARPAAGPKEGGR